ncbi:MAG: hypothetical protein KA116_05710 [Proteobacteria bacterium]|nr:hypothetical protein [Pseudomonadota bacterium]
MHQWLDSIQNSVKKRFSTSKRVLTFDEFMELLESKPELFFRSSFHYILDAIDHFGSYEKEIRNHKERRFKLFDQDFVDHSPSLEGHEELQNSFYRILTGFNRSGKADKLVALFGPNGSAKTSFFRTLFEGLEHYSHQEEGMLFSFSWIFPEEAFQKNRMGIGTRKDEFNVTDSYAKLEQEKIGAIVRSELHENPLFLVPKDDRAAFFEKITKQNKIKDEDRFTKMRKIFLDAELSHKNALIFEALLNEYQGDFSKVMQHIRVERIFLSRSLRNGLVTIEPKFNVDATIRQVTLDRSMANLPPALQSLNLFQLEGDLVDANRGLVEFTDILKRPVESFKYLLNTCETSTVNLGHVVVFLDTVFMASTNDRQLEAFREHPEFYSFKSRLEFIRVPYLLRYSDEENIYERTARDVCGEKELMPHTCRALALWAVLTRIKKPLTKNKSAVLVRVLDSITPIEKAKIYNNAEMPERLTDEERKELKSHIEELFAEHQNHIYYEGLLGASARELKVALQMAAQGDQFKTLGPNAVFAELRKLVKRVSDFDYLRQEPVSGGYHDFENFIQVVHDEWLNWVDQEVRTVLRLHQPEQLEEYLANYLKQVISFVKGEKVKNRMTGQNENADESYMNQFEDMTEVSGDRSEYRKNLISRLGAWSIEHKDFNKEKIPYLEVFPQVIEKLKRYFHKQEVQKLTAMGKIFLDTQNFEGLTSKAENAVNESEMLARKAYLGLQAQFKYGPHSAQEALVELVKSRYR